MVLSRHSANLVIGDTNGAPDVFVHDRQTRTTERVSTTSGGGEADNSSWSPAISADGRYVAFESIATNLVDTDTNGTFDVFVKDRLTGAVELVSVGCTSGLPLFPPTCGQGTGISDMPSLSADGRYVAFRSYANNLVPGDTNGNADVFVRDRTAGTTERVSTGSDNGQGNLASQAPAISANGRFVTFDSLASNLVSGDTNRALDVFVKDRQTGATDRVSQATDGTEGNSASSAPAPATDDGRFVLFESIADNLVTADMNNSRDVLIRDRVAGTTALAVQGNDDTFDAALSPDGRYLVFTSHASDLVAKDENDAADVFLLDRATGALERISLTTTSKEGNDSSFGSAVTPDGRFVAFTSRASNLVKNDTNGEGGFFGLGTNDVFVRDRCPRRC